MAQFLNVSNSQIVPLVILFVIIGIAAVVGYFIYVSAQEIGASASERMGKKNVVFTKDGVRVGVKYVENDNYVSKTQRWVVKAWNLGSEEVEAQSKAKKH